MFIDLEFATLTKQTIIITSDIIIALGTMVNHYTECNNISRSKVTR